MGEPPSPPEISVVVAAYNAEAYIERAIHSALSQRGVAVEVVVVDDGSTDNTLGAVSQIGDLRVKCIRLARNCGPGAARNVGFALSSAPWIAVLDSDDILLPDRLRRLLERARRGKADIVADNLLVFREDDGKTFPMYKSSKISRMTKLDLETFIAGNRAFLGGYALGYLHPMFSAEFLRTHRITYDTDLRIGEDYMFLAEALANGAVCVLESKPGYQYNVRTGSVSHRLALEHVIRLAEADQRFLARFQLNPAAARAHKRRESGLKTAHAFAMLVNALEQRNVAAALDAVGKCPSAALQLWRPVVAHVRGAFRDRAWTERLVFRGKEALRKALRLIV